MKALILTSLVALFSLSTFAANLDPSSLPECKDLRGNVLSGTVDQLKVVMRSSSDRPQVMVTGVVAQVLPEDHAGLPHQKYTLTVGGQIKLLVVSNLDFGRVPVSVGQTLTVCGEYKNVGQGMVHWTHFDPHGGHPDGFTVVAGKLYGDKEVPGFN
ncbi:MAG: DUF3465 domain-containing protein [Bacteriovorax sp.]